MIGEWVFRLRKYLEGLRSFGLLFIQSCSLLFFPIQTGKKKGALLFPFNVLSCLALATSFFFSKSQKGDIPDGGIFSARMNLSRVLFLPNEGG